MGRDGILQTQDKAYQFQDNRAAVYYTVGNLADCQNIRNKCISLINEMYKRASFEPDPESVSVFRVHFNPGLFL